MGQYLVKFTPLEPYFFGNEKTATYGKNLSEMLESGKYFMKSEEIPSQSTILGTLRYILIPNKRADFSYTTKEKEANTGAIGKESFNMEIKKAQFFGKIKSISPLFLLNENSEVFIKMPFNHKKFEEKNEEKNEEKIENKEYTPFKFGEEKIKTSLGEKWLPSDFNAKDGICEDYVKITNGKLEKSLINSVVKTGIKTGENTKDSEGFFKKEYKYLKEGCSFACNAEIEDENLDQRHEIVYMGQGKSAFAVTFEKMTDSIEEKVVKFLNKYNTEVKIKYAFSDTLVSSDIYKDCYFASTKIKNYRGFITKNDEKTHYNRFERGTIVYSLISAGSVFVVKDEGNFNKKIENDNCYQIGYNHIIGGKNNGIKFISY